MVTKELTHYEPELELYRTPHFAESACGLKYDIAKSSRQSIEGMNASLNGTLGIP